MKKLSIGSPQHRIRTRCDGLERQPVQNVDLFVWFQRKWWPGNINCALPVHAIDCLCCSLTVIDVTNGEGPTEVSFCCSVGLSVDFEKNPVPCT